MEREGAGGHVSAASGRLVGRDAEIARLAGFLEHPGRGVAYVVGEPGIGKTALVSELKRLVPDRFVLVARCNELGGLPFEPLVTVLDEQIQHATEPLPRELSQLCVELSSALRPPGGTDDVSRLLDDSRHFLSAVAELFWRLGATGPVLVVIEDSHWADHATASLIDYLCENTDRLTLPFVVTSRSPSGQASVPLSDGTRLRLDLRPLGKSDVDTFARRVLGSPLSSELARDLHAWSGGNPFVLNALLFHAKTEGMIKLAGEHFVGEDLPLQTCPPEVAAWLVSQHRDIDSSGLLLLELAALIGERFDPDLLLRAAELGKGGGALLEQVQGSGLLVADQEQGSSVLRFSHALVRTVFESQIPVVRRRQLHEQIVAALAVSAPRALVERIHHLVAAGRGAEAVPLQLEVAAAALGARSFGEARSLLTDVVGRLHGPERGTALCQLALSLRHTGEVSAAVEAAREGIRLLIDSGRRRQAARERLMLGFYLFENGSVSQSEEEYLLARGELQHFGESEELALAMVWCGAARMVDSDARAAFAHIESGLELAKRLGAKSVEAWAHGFLGCLDAQEGNSGRGIDLVDLSYREGLDLGLDLVAERALANSCELRLSALRAREVEPLLATHRSHGTQGTWRLFRDYELLRSWIELGDFDRALPLARELREAAFAAGAGMILQWVDDAYAALLADSGKPESAIAVLRGTLEGLVGQDVATRSHAQIRYLLVTDECPGAAGVARDALRACSGQVHDYLVAVASASALFAVGSCGELVSLSEAVQHSPGLSGSAWGDMVTGMAALCSEDPQVASDSLSRAANRFATSAYRLHYARCLALQALVTGNERRDARLGASLRILREAGAHGIEMEVGRLAFRGGIISEPLPTTLTKREVEVLSLVARGLTDAGIADELSISRRTVSSHLDRIRDKTKCRRRAELTRLALSLGLVEPTS